MSFYPVMLRPDRGILRIGDGRGITRSSRVMTGREENVRDNGKERKKPLKAVRETSRTTEI